MLVTSIKLLKLSYLLIKINLLSTGYPLSYTIVIPLRKISNNKRILDIYMDT